MLEALRTPDDRFRGLPDYPFEPHYLEDLPGFEGLRLAYVAAGPATARTTFLCLHGQPTWSFLYRKMIPVFAAAGHRAVAPDLFGFGRSDKPVDDAAYDWDLHYRSLVAFIERLDLRRVTLVVHDWGGLLGLTLPMAMPDRVDRLIAMNTMFNTGDIPLPQAFLEWRAWSAAHPDLDVAALMKRACPSLTEGEAAAYAAPFPDATFKAGVRRFPAMVADRPDAPGAELSRQAREWLANEWTGDTFLAVGMQDRILGRPAMELLRTLIRGCPRPLEIDNAGHFVPEHGGEIARAALESFGRGKAGR
jgi:pimeloyl-ACP methyl ester carboxylesterase